MTCFWLISTNCKHFVFMFARLIWFTYFFLGVGVRVWGNSVDFRHKFDCCMEKQEYKIVEDDN